MPLNHPLRTLLVAAIGLAPSLHAQGYTYQILFRAGQTIGGFTVTGLDNSRPKIANDGLVVFYATDSTGVEGLYTPTTKIVRRGDTIAGRALQSINTGAGDIELLNNPGQAIFHGDIGSQGGIYWVDARNPALSSFLPLGAVIAGETLDGGLNAMSLSDIRMPGSVFAGAFIRSSTAAAGVNSALFLTPPPPFTGRLLVFPGVNFAGEANVRPGTIGSGSRNGNHVVFNATTTGGIRLLALSGPAQRRIAGVGDTIGGRAVTGFSYAVINNSGVAGFQASYSGGQIMVTDSSAIADTASPYLGRTLASLSFPRINDSGQIVFHGFRQIVPGSFYNGLFTQSSVVAETNQTIAPATILRSLGTGSINDKGQIAFVGYLGSGGTQAAVIAATPAPNCGAELTGQLSIQRSGIRYNYGTLRYEQVVRVTNTGGAIAGNLLFVLESLSPGVTLANATGTSVCGSGGPMTSLGIAGMAANASATLTLEFDNPSRAAIQHTLRAYSQN